MEAVLMLFTSLITYFIETIPAMVINVLTYIFNGLALSTIAKRRGYTKHWCAWIPVANVWLIGSLSDQYQSMVHNKTTRRGKILLGTYIALYALLFVLLAIMIGMLVFALIIEGDPYAYGYASVAYGGGGVAVGLIIMISLMSVSVLAMSIVSIVATVFQYIALYDLFRSCEPKNATVYLVLSIFIGVAQPFLLYSVRNKDLGFQEPTPPAPQASAYYPPNRPYPAQQYDTYPQQPQAYQQLPQDYQPSPDSTMVLDSDNDSTIVLK